MTDLLRSPLHDLHLELGGRMVPFAGWEMPVQYEGILQEHAAVREACGVFDISHMGQVWVRGRGAREWLDQQLTNDLSALTVGGGQYSFLLNEEGGVIDDLIVYRSGEEEFFLVVNASKRSEDLAWLEDRLPEEGVEIFDESVAFAGMAVQGPEAPSVWAQLGKGGLPERNGIALLEGGAVLCRTGYTGEDGFEFFCPASEGLATLRALLEAGAKACGLGARDTLRLEKCYPLNGSDLSPERTPLQAGLGFFAKLDKKSPFTGKETLLAQKEQGCPDRLVAIVLEGKTPPPRPGYPVLHEGEEVTTLTSGALSPSLGKGIGLAYLPPKIARLGTALEIQIRTRSFPAVVVKKPFYPSA